MLKSIFEEYKIDNKIFAIGFDNASNNIVVISHLINLCNLYFCDRLLIKDVLTIF